MSPSDQTVLRRWITRHDAETFRSIVQRHAGMVYATCRRILRNDSDAEEITQECFESLVRTTERDGPREIGPWLHGMATKKSLMHLRSEGRRRQREAQYAAAQRTRAEPQWNDIYSYVDEAIEELPEEIRSPIVAHFLYGQSHGTIARASGVPRRTVSNRIKKGLELVGESLKKRGIPVATSTLTVMMAAHFTAEAAPTTLTAALGKLALAHSANAAPGISVSGTTGLLGGMLTLKTAIVTIGATLAVIGGLWVARRAQDHGGVEPREEITPSRESLAGDLAHVADELEPPSALSPAEQDEGPQQSVSGMVKFITTNEPAPGVVVEVWRVKTKAKEFQTITDEDGNYMLTGLTPGIPYGLGVESEEEGYVAVETPFVKLRDGEARTAVDITLCAACSISGTITDKSVTYHPWRLASVTPDPHNERAAWETVARALMSTADKPLPGVKIHLLRGFGHMSYICRSEAVSDDRGQYAFPFLPPGGYELRAELPEGAVHLRDKHPETFRSVMLQPGQHKDDVDFSFRFDGVSITGRVTAISGMPIAGAEVTAGYGPRWIGESNTPGRVSLKTVSDEEGRYRLDGLLPPHIRQACLYLSHGLLGEQLPRGEGMVAVCANALGYAPAQILVPPITEDIARDARSAMEQSSRMRDRMRLPSQGPRKPLPEVVLPTSTGNVIHLDFALQPGAAVLGRLFDTRGNVLPESRIHMVFADPPGQKPLAIQGLAPDWTNTDEAGQFIFENVPAGVFLFAVETKALGTQRARNEPLQVSAGELITDIDVIVEAAAERGDIAGHVISASTGSPVEDFSLRVANVDAPTEESPRYGEMTTDKPSGTFRIEGVSAGVATLELKAPGYAREEIKVDVESGQTTPVRFELAPEGILRGYVRRNGQPSGYGSVTTPNVTPNVKHSQYCFTNEEGYYELRELKAGTYLVNFTMWLYEDARGGAQACERLWVDVESGQETRLDIDYQGSGIVHGTFEGPEEYKWAVRVFDSSLPEENQLRAATWKFRENRHYEIVDIPPGTYTVVGICAGEDGAVLEKSETISLDEGETTRVDFIF